jgi:hypothetical protein
VGDAPTVYMGVRLRVCLEGRARADGGGSASSRRTLPALAWHRQNWAVLRPLVDAVAGTESRTTAAGGDAAAAPGEWEGLASEGTYIAGFTDRSIAGREDLYDVFVDGMSGAGWRGIPTHSATGASYTARGATVDERTVAIAGHAKSTHHQAPIPQRRSPASLRLAVVGVCSSLTLTHSRTHTYTRSLSPSLSLPVCVDMAGLLDDFMMGKPHKEVAQYLVAAAEDAAAAEGPIVKVRPCATPRPALGSRCQLGSLHWRVSLSLSVAQGLAQRTKQLLATVEAAAAGDEAAAADETAAALRAGTLPAALTRFYRALAAAEGRTLA